MFRRTFAMILSGTLLLSAFSLQLVCAQSGNDAKRDTGAVEKTRTKVQKIGVGGKARVEIKLRDNTQLKGFISDAGRDSFTVVDTKTGASKSISYADTSSVKKAGSGFSTKTWIILGAAVVGTIVTWVIVKPAFCDGGNVTRFPC